MKNYIIVVEVDEEHILNYLGNDITRDKESIIKTALNNIINDNSFLGIGCDRVLSTPTSEDEDEILEIICEG